MAMIEWGAAALSCLLWSSLHFEFRWILWLSQLINVCCCLSTASGLIWADARLRLLTLAGRGQGV